MKIEGSEGACGSGELRQDLEGASRRNLGGGGLGAARVVSGSMPYDAGQDLCDDR